jgi:hypothetical protein
MHLRRLCLSLALFVFAVTAFGQQTGSIAGKVTATDGSALPGVTVEARSNVLPQPRVTTTDAAGNYTLSALQPGNYTLSFSLEGMQTVSRPARVLLSETTNADARLGVAGVSESITVTAEATLVNKVAPTLSTAVSSEQLQALPIGQDYRDLVKLAPGVQLTNDTTRGPSAGGSGQDNVYQFDGVNVTLPLFGTLSAEPATHDVAQLTSSKNWPQAIDFNRSGGFTIDSVSKSGTNKFSGMISYQVQNHTFNSKPDIVLNSDYEQDRSWGTVNLGGPILQDRLFFYGSYYRPTVTRNNRANLYGTLPQYKSNRSEEFGKLTFTPTSSLLFNGSYRTSHRLDKSTLFGSTQAPSTGSGNESRQKIGILEGSWITGAKSYATMKFNDFKLYTQGRPDNPVTGVTISTALGTQLDINNLANMGLLTVPTLVSATTTNAAAINAFRQRFIDAYGYTSPTTGLKTGGGLVGSGSQFDKDDFFRRSGQLGYNHTLGTSATHDLHFGYQRYIDSENLTRSSNGWGSITVQGGSSNCTAAICGTVQPIFFTANLAQQSKGVPTIHSEFQSQNLEFNDTIHLNNWSINLGVMASNDTLYGQGLAKADNIAGFVSSPGTKYKMYSIPWMKMLQPRLGATYAYNGRDTVYGSWSRYNPTVNSLPRAASWDRNLVANINAYFDANGKLIGIDPDASSSGKLFVDDLDPRVVNEVLIGTARQMTSRWSARLYARSRKATHFWEDTNNGARVSFNRGGVQVPSNTPINVPRELYVPDFAQKRTAIGSGSTYVIADLDGSFTKYYEATVETDWNGAKTFLKGTYTWSHYYGNFDQDNTSPTLGGDFNTFYGSSNIADGAGRQLWDNKYGLLRGDRRNIIKVYGGYRLPWNATAGFYSLYQSGQPFELWSYLPYASMTTSTSDTDRFLEPSGSRRTPAHYQTDINYTQNFRIMGLNLQLAADVFNIMDKQTGYNYENRVGTLGFVRDLTAPPAGAIQTSVGLVNPVYPRSSWSPRRFQIAARLQF